MPESGWAPATGNERRPQSANRKKTRSSSTNARRSKAIQPSVDALGGLYHFGDLGLKVDVAGAIGAGPIGQLSPDTTAVRHAPRHLSSGGGGGSVDAWQ